MSCTVVNNKTNAESRLEMVPAKDYESIKDVVLTNLGGQVNGIPKLTCIEILNYKRSDDWSGWVKQITSTEVIPGDDNIPADAVLRVRFTVFPLPSSPLNNVVMGR